MAFCLWWRDQRQEALVQAAYSAVASCGAAGVPARCARCKAATAIFCACARMAHPCQARCWEAGRSCRPLRRRASRSDQPRQSALRTKQILRLVIEKALINNQMELLSVYTNIGVRPRKSLEQRGNKASTTDGYWIVKKGDMVSNKLLAWMGAIGVSHYEGVTSPAYDVLRSIKSCNTDYYHFLFRTKKISPAVQNKIEGHNGYAPPAIF